MFYEEIVVFLVYVLPHVLATSCMPKCGIPSKWLPIANNVCYGTKNNEFGRFIMNRDCDLYAIRLTHVSGFQSWNKNDVTLRSRWGYANRPEHLTRICTIILKDGKRLIPKKIDDDQHQFYSINGFSIGDDVIIIRQNETLAAGEELDVAFGLDFKDQRENKNEGTHCVDVDVSCYV